MTELEGTIRGNQAERIRELEAENEKLRKEVAVLDEANAGLGELVMTMRKQVESCCTRPGYCCDMGSRG